MDRPHQGLGLGSGTVKVGLILSIHPRHQGTQLLSYPGALERVAVGIRGHDEPRRDREPGGTQLAEVGSLATDQVVVGKGDPVEPADSLHFSFSSARYSFVTKLP